MDTEKTLYRSLELSRLWGVRHVPEILIMGPVNAGKSTLINRLLENDICPVDASPSTFLPIRLMTGDEYAARVSVKGKLRPIQNNKQLSDLVGKKAAPKGAERIDIQLPAGLLNWCTLVDTPGVGFSRENDQVLEKLISTRPGIIIFLLHQRGVDTSTHRFLGALSKTLHRNTEISFWINSNTGSSDGTPLPETRAVLRELFPGRGKVHLINTRDPKSLEVLTLYIKSSISGQRLRRLEMQLRENDRTIPARVNKIARIKNDEEFLLKYWDLIEETQNILLGREMLNSIPVITGEINSRLDANTARLIQAAENSGAPSLIKEGAGSQSPDLREILSQLAGDGSLAPYINPGRLEEIKNRLREKKCAVVAVGSFSSGKTTFFNALLGDAILPAEDRATTSCAVILKHGPEQKAVVSRLQQAEFYLVEKKGDKYRLDNEELTNLRHLLADPAITSQISGAQASRDGRPVSIPKEKLPALLTDTITYFTRTGESKPGAFSVPLFSKILSRRAVSNTPPATWVRINFKKARRYEFNLADPEERENFYKATSPPYSFLVEQVELRHPAPVLKNATFIDTPGVDSLHGRHRLQAVKRLAAADICLLFLHGKQVLTEGLTGPEIFSEPDKTPAHIFYVINFADTLNQLEREKVSLFVRQKMPLRTGNSPIPYHGVYLISALQAAQKGDEGFMRLMRRLEKTIRDIDFEEQINALKEIEELLKEASTRISGPRDSRKSRADGADAVELYLRELGRVEKKLTVPGRVTIH